MSELCGTPTLGLEVSRLLWLPPASALFLKIAILLLQSFWSAMYRHKNITSPRMESRLSAFSFDIQSRSSASSSCCFFYTTFAPTFWQTATSSLEKEPIITQRQTGRQTDREQREKEFHGGSVFERKRCVSVCSKGKRDVSNSVLSHSKLKSWQESSSLIRRRKWRRRLRRRGNEEG